MNIFEWNKTEQSFVEVSDLTFIEEAGGDEDGIQNAGYSQEISSYEHSGDGAGIRVYSARKEGYPEYFISIAGMNSGMASLVARDFPSLIETLKQLHPLLTLIGLDQFNFARVADEVDRELG